MTDMTPLNVVLKHMLTPFIVNLHNHLKDGPLQHHADVIAIASILHVPLDMPAPAAQQPPQLTQQQPRLHIAPIATPPVAHAPPAAAAAAVHTTPIATNPIYQCKHICSYI